MILITFRYTTSKNISDKILDMSEIYVLCHAVTFLV